MPGGVGCIPAEATPGMVSRVDAQIVKHPNLGDVAFFIVWVRFGDENKFYECSERYDGPETFVALISEMNDKLHDAGVIPKPFLK